jgi:RNA polymerase sigma factor (TIGR02999 family)
MSQRIIRSSNSDACEPSVRLEKRRALDDLYSSAYDELRRLASCIKRRDGGASLSPTALVNEAWLKLASSPELAWTSHVHFKRIAARAMRQVLIEAARRRTARKRGGPGANVVALDDAAVAAAVDCGDDLLALDAALDELARVHPRQALFVEMRFFGGLTAGEIATSLGVSETTVLRDWRAARAWLADQLRRH